jgi:YHS domain-containing protein
VQGLAEYAASYHNNVFVFSSEENMKEFMKEPKIFLR